MTAKAEQLDLGLSGEVTAVSWVPAGHLNFEQWAKEIAIVGRLGQTSLFLLGDGLVVGEQLFGEQYAQALDSTGYSEKTIQNLMWVAQRVPPELRREELSHGHHEAVAHLEPQDQAKWLQKAIDQHWTREELRAALKGTHPKDADKDPQDRAPLSEKRQQELKEAFERVVARWYEGLLKDREAPMLGKDKAFRAREFERLANLAVKAAVKVLGG